MNADLDGIVMQKTIQRAGSHQLTAFAAHSVANQGHTLPSVGHQRIVVCQQPLRNSVPERQDLRVAFRCGLPGHQFDVLEGQQVFQDVSHGHAPSQLTCRSAGCLVSQFQRCGLELPPARRLHD